MTTSINKPQVDKTLLELEGTHRFISPEFQGILGKFKTGQPFASDVITLLGTDEYQFSTNLGLFRDFMGLMLPYFTDEEKMQLTKLLYEEYKAGKTDRDPDAILGVFVVVTKTINSQELKSRNLALLEDLLKVNRYNEALRREVGLLMTDIDPNWQYRRP